MLPNSLLEGSPICVGTRFWLPLEMPELQEQRENVIGGGGKDDNNNGSGTLVSLKNLPTSGFPGAFPIAEELRVGSFALL